MFQQYIKRLKLVFLGIYFERSRYDILIEGTWKIKFRCTLTYDTRNISMWYKNTIDFLCGKV